MRMRNVGDAIGVFITSVVSIPGGKKKGDIRVGMRTQNQPRSNGICRMEGVFIRSVLSIPGGKTLDKNVNLCISGKRFANLLTFT